MESKPGDKVLDVGVTPQPFREMNYLESWLPYPQNIAAVANQDVDEYQEFKETFLNELNLGYSL
jgi:hypothetical protein